MSVVYAPQRPVLITRFLNNPSDTGTYFCKAFVYDAITSELLDSFALTDNGGKNFSQLWQTPADPSGEGRQIIVSIGCYDDSGYTSESPVYGTEKEMWVLQTQTVNFGGGGAGFDYDGLIREVKKLLDAAEKPEADLSPVFDSIDRLRVNIIDKFESLKKQEKPEIDVATIQKAIEDGIASLKDTSGGVENLIEALGSAFAESMGSLNETHTTMNVELKGAVESTMEKIFADLRDILDKGNTSLTEAVKKVSDDFMNNPITISLAPQGELKAKVGRQESKPLRPLQQLAQSTS